MPKEIFPSSYQCDCGEQVHFGENTVNEIKRMSMRKEVRLAEGDHVVVFRQGRMVDVICPSQTKKRTTRKGHGKA